MTPRLGRTRPATARSTVVLPAPERKRRRGAEAAGRERQRNAHEDTPGTGAERSRRGEQALVDRFEGGDRPADEERALDECDREHDRRLRAEPDVDPPSVEVLADEPEAAERREKPDACDDRR